MMTQFVQETDRIDITATAEVKAGNIVEAGALHGVAITDMKQGEVGAIKVTGVFKVTANKADIFAVGDVVNFDTDKGSKNCCTRYRYRYARTSCQSWCIGNRYIMRITGATCPR